MNLLHSNNWEISKLEHKIPPPALALLLVLMMSLGSTFLSQSELLIRLKEVLLSFFFLAAAFYGFSAFFAFSRAKTTINPVKIEEASSLVTDGIYKYSRNPMYVALTSILCCIASYYAILSLFLFPLFFVLFIHRFQIIPEERMLLAKFGDTFLEYRTTVRRWL